MALRVTHIISNLGIGGAESSLCSLVEALRDSDIENAIVSMISDGAFAPRLRAAGATVVEMGATRSVRTTLQIRHIGEALRDSRPDLIHGWMYHANLAASVASLFGYSRAPVLWSVRQSLEKLSNNRVLTRGVIVAGGLLAFSARRILYNSEVAIDHHARFGYPRKKAVVIENAIDTERFRPRQEAAATIRRELNLNPYVRLIGRVGRNAPMKGNDTLLAAFENIAAAMPDVHLVFIGPDMLKQDTDLAARIARSSVAGRVHCMEARLDIEQFYPAFDLVVSSSRNSEGFPNTVAEAAVSGTPVVATDIGGSRSILDNAHLLVPPENPEALAHKCMEILAMPESARRQIGLALRQSVMSRFASDVVARRYVALWRSIIEEAKS